MARPCSEIQADIDAIDARLKAIALGTSIEESQYAGHRVKYSQADPVALRRLRAELEDEACAAGCKLTRARGGNAIRPVL